MIWELEIFFQLAMSANGLRIAMNLVTNESPILYGITIV